MRWIIAAALYAATERTFVMRIRFLFGALLLLPTLPLGAQQSALTPVSLKHSPPALIKPCDPDQFAVLQDYLQDTQKLQAKAKAESVSSFVSRFHRRTASSYLGLLSGAYSDAATSYAKAGDAADHDTAQQTAKWLMAYKKAIDNASTDQAAQKLLNSMPLQLKLPGAAQSPASTPAKSGKPSKAVAS